MKKYVLIVCENRWNFEITNCMAKCLADAILELQPYCEFELDNYGYAKDPNTNQTFAVCEVIGSN